MKNGIIAQLRRRVLFGGRRRKRAKDPGGPTPAPGTKGSGAWLGWTKDTGGPAAATEPVPTAASMPALIGDGSNELRRDELVRVLEDTADELDAAHTASGAVLTDPLADVLRRVVAKLRKPAA